MRIFAAFLMLIGLCGPAAARDAATPIETRAAQLPDMLIGSIKPDAYFAPAFLNAIPVAQVKQIADQLVAENGAVRSVAALRAETDLSGEVDISFERATVTMQIVAAKDAPHLVIGLQVTGVTAHGDSLSKLSAEFAALPGKAGFLIAKHGSGEAFDALAAVNAEAPLAIASTFKLWVLAEAAAQVMAKSRQWSDVIPLGPASLPSGVTQDWPKAAPMTLHSLATLMISVSDNTATDTLMTALGREAVDSRVAALGRTGARQTLPTLNTLEAFVLKNPVKSRERALWETGSITDRRAMLQALKPTLAMIDRAALGSTPAYINSIEWFASPNDIAASFGAIRRSGSKEAMEILAINRSLSLRETSRFAYVGYKGGSEVGVMSMSYVIQTKAGAWFTVTGSWNNQAAAVDERQFEAMMQRAVNMVR